MPFIRICIQITDPCMSSWPIVTCTIIEGFVQNVQNRSYTFAHLLDSKTQYVSLAYIAIATKQAVIISNF